jgi:DNA polymerase I-like protein with 3'-5' exonuclease and polymerase domains
VKVIPSESTTCEGCRSGRCSTTFQLPPLWDLRARANTREVIYANLARAVRHAEGAELVNLNGAYRILSTRAEAEAWIQVRLETHILAIDIEGDGDPSTVHASRHEIICLGIHDGTETVILPEHLFLEGLWPELADLLEAAVTVAHNGKFDAAVLGWTLRGENNPIEIDHDTMLAHYALWPAGGDDDEHADSASTSFAYHGLKLLGDLYFGWGNWALTRTQYENMRSVGLHEMYAYNAKDVQRTHLLLQLFRDQFRIRAEQMHAYINVLMPASNHLTWQEDTGVCVDVPYVKAELVPVMTQEVEEATRGLIYQANQLLPGHPWPLVAPAKRLPGETSKEARRFNPGSADQIRVILESQGVELPIDRKSKSKKGSTSKRTLELLMRGDRKGDPFLTQVLDRRRVEKILGTYAIPLATRSHDKHPYDGLRVFPGLHLHKTLTGRLASSDPNIQNQPKLAIIRRAYIPSRPGRVVFQTDFSQAELRVMAVLGKDRFLTKIFKDPSLDVFDGMMPGIFTDIDFEKNPEKYAELRRPLKACIYGLAFARGAKDIAEDLNMEVEHTQAIIDGFLSSALGVTRWRQDVIDRIQYDIPLVSRLGRYFLHPPINDQNRDDINRSALSFLPQSSASDCCLLAAVELGKHIRKNKLDWDMSALIHDAIIMDVPQDQVEEAMQLTGEFMVASAAKWFPEVPFAVDSTWGWSWADFDDKKLQKEMRKLTSTEIATVKREELV